MWRPLLVLRWSQHSGLSALEQGPWTPQVPQSVQQLVVKCRAGTDHSLDLVICSDRIELQCSITVSLAAIRSSHIMHNATTVVCNRCALCLCAGDVLYYQRPDCLQCEATNLQQHCPDFPLKPRPQSDSRLNLR